MNREKDGKRDKGRGGEKENKKTLSDDNLNLLLG